MADSSNGLVAIVDALGAADYSRERVEAFLEVRDLIVKVTTRFAETQVERILKEVGPVDLRLFVFQDTIIIVYERTDRALELRDMVWFGHILRVAEMIALQKGVLLRGSFASGEFYRVSIETNTVLGPAVRDAARWYDQADWVGIHATPRTSLLIQSYLDRAKTEIEFVLVPYDVPLKAKGERARSTSVVPVLYAVNWPKALHIQYENNSARVIRGQLASWLATDDIPPGVEQKHSQAIKFFDSIVSSQGLHEPYRVRLTDPAARNPAR